MKSPMDVGKSPNDRSGASPKRPLRATRVKSATLPLRPPKATARPVLITGGAGFIGTNVAQHFLSLGQPVVLYDNLSRPGVERNLAWLRETFGELVRVEVADVQDFEQLRRAVRGVSKVFHFAAQVAVTTSLSSPFYDFEVNARGTLNLLEALRELSEPPPLIFTSTNKVYGNLDDVRLRATATRYEPEQAGLRGRGFDETRPLDFHSPYGCSKGAAEQYVLDYARTFGLRAVVFRMSCIYGPHQFGTEDQGWVAHFLIRALEAQPITIYGDGKQVRDILFVADLIQAFVRAFEHMKDVSGQAFNIGGSPANTISLLELIETISQLQKSRPLVRFDDWRPADQQYYVSNTDKFTARTGWKPRVQVREGIQLLIQWLREHRKTPSVPVVMASPSTSAVTEFNNSANNGALRPAEPRSKRMWRLVPEQPGALGGKIIKFP